MTLPLKKKAAGPTTPTGDQLEYRTRETNQGPMVQAYYCELYLDGSVVPFTIEYGRTAEEAEANCTRECAKNLQTILRMERTRRRALSMNR